MPIDPTGTAPGVAPTPKEPETVHMRCKKEGCDSILATEIKLPNMDRSHMYRCVKCGKTHVTPTGGSFNFF